MMGRRNDEQGQLFYCFDLDKVVPPDHLVRQIDGVLDLGWVHKELAPYYSHTGRPSIDPVLMIRMLIVGYVFALRSERRLCSEVQVNLAYRWFCKLGIEDKIPDHSVFCRARHERFRESDALRRVFEGVVARCIAAGLVGGEAFSVDASLIKADVDKKKRAPGDRPIAWPKAEEASRAVREYLAALDAAGGAEEKGGGDGGGSSGGGSRRKPPKEVSLTDPQAAWVKREGIEPFFAYECELSHRQQGWDHHRRRGYAGQSLRGDCLHPDHGGPRRAPFRSPPSQARRRHRLWCNKAAQVAGRSRDHATRSGVGPIGPLRWHLQPS
jgi:transposase